MMPPRVTLSSQRAAVASSEGDSNLVQSLATKATLVLLVRVPTPRTAHYVSLGTKGMTLLFKGPTRLNKAFALKPGAPGCTGKAVRYECTFDVKLLPGKYTGTISMYDMAPVAGHIPVTAKLLSYLQNVPFKVLPNVVNRFKFTSAGVVSKITIGTLPGGTIGTAFVSPQPLSITAQDADGYTIVGKYENAVTLSDSDLSGATTLTTAGSDHPPAGQLVSSHDTVALNYTGAGIASAVIGANATGAIGANATFAPVPVITSLSATTGYIATSVSETLTGHFVPGATTINVSGTGITLSHVTPATATTIGATFSIDLAAATGARGVTAMVTGGATSAAQTFTISNTGVDVVTKNTDTAPGTPPGSGAGTSGDLRYVMLNAHAGDTIVFDTNAMCGGASCTITLGGPLPPIVQNQTIDGGTFGRVTIDGNNLYRALWIDTGTVTLADLQIQNALAHGGNGGNSIFSGGGGAGLGAGLFVNQANATANVENVYFLSDAVHGGDGGGASPGGPGGGGGGGMGGNGGNVTNAYSPVGGAGGGGVLGVGTDSGTPTTGQDNGAIGGLGGGGGGGGCCAGCGAFANGVGGMGGAYYAAAINGAGSNGPSCTTGAGGAGGFGGGGGGAASTSGAGLGGGAGGFGGGGGGSDSNTAGSGGPGGGGGGSYNGVGYGGLGGALSPAVHGGNGAAGGAGSYGGGGGAAAGPAIFVNAGMLTTTNSGASSSSATAGAAGPTSNGIGSFTDGSPGTADATPVFNYTGTVNGSTTKGPVASALGTTAPSLRRLHRTKRMSP
jgi:hypothetical protein